MLDAKDVPKIVDKGLLLARGLLDPDTFRSIAVLQKQKKYGPFEYDVDKAILTIHTPSGKKTVNPDKITEQGVAICKADGNIRFEQGGRQGIAMTITPEMCKGSHYIGSLHTHPGGSPTPSTGDLSASTHNRDQIMCIAARTSREKVAVNCYIPQSEFLPEEIMQIERQHQERLSNWAENQMQMRIMQKQLKEFIESPQGKELKKRGMNVDKMGLVGIPVHSEQQIKWFSSTMLEDIEPYYEIKKFEGDI